MALSQSSVLKLYTSVIEDVIAGVRDSFLDEGVDEQYLQELKLAWEAKLQASRAVEQNTEPPEPQPMGSILRNAKISGNKKTVGNTIPDGSEEVGNQAGFVDQAGVLRSEKLYPVQITLPAQQGSGETAPRVLTIQVPESAITGNQLQAVLTGPIIGTTLSLPTQLATSLLQQHVTAALRGQQTGSLLSARPFSVQGNGTSQLDGTVETDICDTPGPSSPPQVVQHSVKRMGLFKFKVTVADEGKEGKCSQVDGGIDTSDEDDDDDEDEDVDEDEEEKEEEPEYLEGAEEEEPLNSGDDVSEEDVTDLFDTDNVVVCQYDKITRSRNKWKFYLKDGIMNLSGRDFVFQRSNGDAEW